LEYSSGAVALKGYESKTGSAEFKAIHAWISIPATFLVRLKGDTACGWCDKTDKNAHRLDSAPSGSSAWIVHELEALIGKAFKGAAVLHVPQCLDNAADESLRFTQRVKTFWQRLNSAVVATRSRALSL
jgi:hypothetical protein